MSKAPITLLTFDGSRVVPADISGITWEHLDALLPILTDKEKEWYRNFKEQRYSPDQVLAIVANTRKFHPPGEETKPSRSHELVTAIMESLTAEAT